MVRGARSPPSVSNLRMSARSRQSLRIAGWFVVLEGIFLGVLVTAVAGGTFTGAKPTVATFTSVAAGLLPILASLVATYAPRTAVRMILWTVPLTPLWMLLFAPDFGGIGGSIAVFTGVILIPSCFWYLAARRNWPPPMAGSSISRRRRLRAILLVALSCFFLAIAFFWSLALPWWPPIGDCQGHPVLDEQGHPQGINFTAKILFLAPKTFRGMSLWSIVRIEERFSGLSWWTPNVIFVRNIFDPADASTEYLIEGTRSYGALTRFLPLVERSDCGYTNTSGRAQVAIRILRDGPPKSGARLIGWVSRDRWTDRRPVPRFGISVEGPSDSFVLWTDADGIYDITALPPGRYTLDSLAKGANDRSGFRGGKTFDLKAGEIGSANFYLQ
jgi:hypothetical protein